MNALWRGREPSLVLPGDTKTWVWLFFLRIYLLENTGVYTGTGGREGGRDELNEQTAH